MVTYFTPLNHCLILTKWKQENVKYVLCILDEHLNVMMTSFTPLNHCLIFNLAKFHLKKNVW